MSQSKHKNNKIHVKNNEIQSFCGILKDQICEKEDPRCGKFFTLKNLGCAIDILCNLESLTAASGLPEKQVAIVML